MLTHEHADAINGLDDIRSLQVLLFSKDFKEITSLSPKLNVYCDDFTYNSVSQRFPYLVEQQTGSVLRAVAQMYWNTISHYQPVITEGLTVLPIPVKHGEDYNCVSYVFGRDDIVVYMSDVSRVELKTQKIIDNITEHMKEVNQTGQLILNDETESKTENETIPASSLPIDSTTNTIPSISSATFPTLATPTPGQISILFLDCLFKHGSHNTHFTLDNCKEYIVRLRPKRTILIGLTEVFEYNSDNPEIIDWGKENGLCVEYGYDGMRIPVKL